MGELKKLEAVLQSTLQRNNIEIESKNKLKNEFKIDVKNDSNFESKNNPLEFRHINIHYTRNFHDKEMTYASRFKTLYRGFYFTLSKLYMIDPRIIADFQSLVETYGYLTDTEKKKLKEFRNEYFIKNGHVYNEYLHSIWLESVNSMYESYAHEICLSKEEEKKLKRRKDVYYMLYPEAMRHTILRNPERIMPIVKR